MKARPPQDALEKPLLVTFYSFKGGVGRTLALWNVAARMAAQRYRVLTVDADLEAPGLTFAHLDDSQRAAAEGFSEIANDWLRDLRILIKARKASAENVLLDYLDRLRQAVQPSEMPPPEHADLLERLRREGLEVPERTGCLDILSAGRLDEHYAGSLSISSLGDAYSEKIPKGKAYNLRRLLSHFREAPPPEDFPTIGQLFSYTLRGLIQEAFSGGEGYDYVLLDSRSGLADIGGLCLRALPDIRVVLSGLNKQNVAGTNLVLATLPPREKDRLLLVFSPVPEGELELLEARLADAARIMEVDEEQILTLHYHPRLALQEEVFDFPYHRTARIHEEYRKLHRRVQRLSGKDAESLIAGAMLGLRGTEPERQEFPKEHIDALVKAALLEPSAALGAVEGLCTQLFRSPPKEANPRAVDLFRLWSAIEPEPGRGLYAAATFRAIMAEKSWKSGERAQAEPLFQESFASFSHLMDRNPENTEAWYNWGLAVQTLAGLVADADPDRARLLLEESLEKYRRAAEADPKNAEAWYNWALSLQTLAGLVADADEGRARSLLEDSFEKCSRAAQADPEDAATWSNWGNALQKLAGLVADADRDRACSLLEDSFEKCSRAIQTDPGLAVAWYNWGNAQNMLAGLVADADPDRARSLLEDSLEKYRRAAEADHGYAAAWYNWGRALTALAGRVADTHPDRARSLLVDSFEKWSRTVQADPEMAAAWANWGSALGTLGEVLADEEPKQADLFVGEALRKFEKALLVGGDDAQVWLNWGRAFGWLTGRLYSTNRTKEAMDLESEALKKLEESVSRTDNSQALSAILRILETIIETEAPPEANRKAIRERAAEIADSLQTRAAAEVSSGSPEPKIVRFALSQGEGRRPSSKSVRTKSKPGKNRPQRSHGGAKASKK